MSLTSAVRSLPPSSARAICLQSGISASSAEIVGVGLNLEAHRRRRDEMIIEPVFPAVSDRRIAGRKFQTNLRVRVTRTVPPRQWIGPDRLVPLELEQPAAGIRLAGLGGSAIDLGDAGDSHRGAKWQRPPSKSTREFRCQDW